MNINKTNIGLLLGDPSGIGPELTVKLLDSDISEKANVIVIGERKVLELTLGRGRGRFLRSLLLVRLRLGGSSGGGRRGRRPTRLVEGWVLRVELLGGIVGSSLGGRGCRRRRHGSRRGCVWLKEKMLNPPC